MFFNQTSPQNVNLVILIIFNLAGKNCDRAMKPLTLSRILTTVQSNFFVETFYKEKKIFNKTKLNCQFQQNFKSPGFSQLKLVVDVVIFSFLTFPWLCDVFQFTYVCFFLGTDVICCPKKGSSVIFIKSKLNDKCQLTLVYLDYR